MSPESTLTRRPGLTHEVRRENAALGAAGRLLKQAIVSFSHRSTPQSAVKGQS